MVACECWGEEVRWVGDWAGIAPGVSGEPRVQQGLGCCRCPGFCGVLCSRAFTPQRGSGVLLCSMVVLDSAGGRRKSEFMRGPPPFWMRETLERTSLLEGGKDQYVRRSWGMTSPMISAPGFLGRTYEWRWMKKTHGIESLLTHLCLSKRHPPSQGPCTVLFKALFHF